jgi:undecaprenyl diphosphate synthase
MSMMTTKDDTQICYQEWNTGGPSVFSPSRPLRADVWESQTKMVRSNIPRHVGFIPDGNRRWATAHRQPREAGYVHGINPGLLLCEKCNELGIEEVSIYGFTQDNTKRPSIQKQAFSEACIAFALEIARRGAALLVLGDETSTQFPKVLTEFRHRQGVGMKVNLLVNYGWEWDLAGIKNGGLRSSEVSRLDLIVRWGGGCRLSGFLPVQSVYADFYVRDEYWPDFDPQHFDQALDWFKNQDQTLGG